MRTRRILLALIGAVAVLPLAEQSASAYSYKQSCTSSACIAQRAQRLEAERRAREAKIKAANRAAARARQEQNAAAMAKQMADEIQAEKASKAKRDAEPGVTTQKCQLINGELVCQ